jgi:hypothetical protein
MACPDSWHFGGFQSVPVAIRMQLEKDFARVSREMKTVQKNVARKRMEDGLKHKPAGGPHGKRKKKTGR